MSHLRAPKTQPHRISLREVSFPCQFICRYCFFYLLCLTYFTEDYVQLIVQRGVRAGSNLSILKEAKKNYMGQFIFSRGVGVYLLIPKKKQLFMAFPWVETSTGPGGFMICVFII